MKQSPERQSTHKVICRLCKKPNRYKTSSGTTTHAACLQKVRKEKKWA